MGHYIHPNQFPTMPNITEEEESSESARNAMKFSERIDQDDEVLRRRRRRRAEGAAAAAVTCRIALAHVAR